MRQIRITKRRHRADGGRQAPLTHDPRDPDIVRAHEAARRLARSRAGRARPAGPVRTKPAHGNR